MLGAQGKPSVCVQNKVEVAMIGNIIGGAVILVWLALAVRYIVRQKKDAKEAGNPICIGCPGAATCKHHSCAKAK